MIYPHIELEKELWEQGYRYIVGVDEVGRGPLAGPVVVGALVISPESKVLDYVRDSKTMTAKKRELADVELRRTALACATGTVSVEELDEIGMTQAILEATRRAVIDLEKSLGARVDYIIADGPHVALMEGYKQKRIVDGDAYHYSIAAASVIAKVERDAMMSKFAELYPQYGFEKHAGYGTKAHLAALREFGPCPIHRKSFRPIADMLASFVIEDKN